MVANGRLPMALGARTVGGSHTTHRRSDVLFGNVVESIPVLNFENKLADNAIFETRTSMERTPS